MKYVLRRIGTMSAVKTLALLEGLLFLLIGIVYGGISIILSLVGGQLGAGLLNGAGICLAFVIGFPLAGVVSGAVTGALISVLYNTVADYVGGFELSLSDRKSVV